MNTWTELLVLIVCVPFLVTLHEAGHALMARPAGFRVTSFGVGFGKPLVRHRGQGGVVYYVGRWFFGGGSCVAVPRGLGHGVRASLYHVGGVLAQGVLGLLLLTLPDWAWVEPVQRFNVLVIVWNLVPWRFGGLASDGWWLLAASPIWRSPGQQLHGKRRVFERLLQHEQVAQSPLGVWYSRAMLAWTDLLVGGDPGEFFRIEHPESTVDPHFDALHHMLEAEWHRTEGRPLAAMRKIRELRDAYGPSFPDEANDLLTLAEARVWLDLDEPRACRQALARVAGVGGVVGNEAASIVLRAALSDGNADDIEVFARRLSNRIGNSFLDAPAAVGNLWDAAQVLLDDGRTQVHHDLSRTAQRAATQLLTAATLLDRNTLIRRLGPPAGVARPQERVL